MMIIRLIQIFNGYYAYKLSKYQNNNMFTKYVLEINTIQYLLQKTYHATNQFILSLYLIALLLF